MKIYLTGNPLNKRKDNIPIYTDAYYMPSSQPWENKLSINAADTSKFIENLYFVTLEANGFCYFYPNINTKTKLCRFEWHYDFRGEDYFLRLGFCFKEGLTGIFDFEYYIQTHEQYKDLTSIPKNEFSITKEEDETIKAFIQQKIDIAISRIVTEPVKLFNFIYYIKLLRFVKEVTFLTDEITLLPSKILDDKNVSAIILPQKGFSYISCQRFASEKVNLLCAIWSLCIDHIGLINIKDSPSYSEIEHDNTKLLLEKLDKIYPNSKPIIKGGFKNVSKEDIDSVRWVFDCLKKINSKKKKRKLVNILFSYYSALEAMLINRTSALVGFVACMETISKEFDSDFYNKNGSRKSIVNCIDRICERKHEITEIENWSKRIYNEHRSSYVHGANIKFEEYSQNMDGQNFAGLPNSFSSPNNIVGKQYEYENDLDVLKGISKIVLFKYIEYISMNPILKSILFPEIDFTVKSIPEAYLGLVNNGWMRATNNKKPSVI